MQSPEWARTGSTTTLVHRLCALIVRLSVMGLLVLTTAPLYAQHQSSDMTPSNEARKGGGGPVTPPQANANASLDLSTLNLTDLLHECDHNGIEIQRQLLSYTYRLRKIRREYNDEGRSTEKQVQEFEAYPARGQHVLIQLRENGQPLPSTEIEWQRRRAGEQLEQAEREAAQHTEASQAAPDEPDGYPAAGVYSRVRRHPVAFSIDPSAILRNGELREPRVEQIGERETLVLDFHMRPGVTLPSRRTYLARLHGRVWIDVADKVIVRIEAWPTDEFRKHGAAITVEPSLVYQQTRLDSGAWVPTLMRINSCGNPMLFDGLNWDVVFEFTDYKQFKTSADDLKIDPKTVPKKSHDR